MSQRISLPALRCLLVAMFLLAGPSFASTPAGLCAPTAQSLEAPPPIYPGHEGRLEACDESSRELGWTLPPGGDDQPHSTLDLDREIKAAGSPGTPCVVQCERLEVAHATPPRNSGCLLVLELLRPPRA